MLEGFEVIIGKYLSKLAEPRVWGSILALLFLTGVFAVISKVGRNNGSKSISTRLLAYGSLAIALSSILSFIKIIGFPNGGSITVASMLPLILFALLAGPSWAMLAGVCYGMIQYFQEPFFVHWAQFLLDYPLAFAMLGLAGLFKNKIYVGAVIACLARFVCHFISGVVFFGEYANGQNVFLYSLIYNGSYILPDMIICLVVMAIPSVKKMIFKMTHGFN